MEPQTLGGEGLAAFLGGLLPEGDFRDQIAHIEAEAQRAALTSVRVAMTGLTQHWVHGQEWDCSNELYGPRCKEHGYTSADPFLDRAAVIAAIDERLKGVR